MKRRTLIVPTFVSTMSASVFGCASRKRWMIERIEAI